MIMVKDDYCTVEGQCFAKGEITGRCKALTEAYKKGQDCPFKKVDRHYTNGVYYPDYPYEGKKND